MGTTRDQRTEAGSTGGEGRIRQELTEAEPHSRDTRPVLSRKGPTGDFRDGEGGGTPEGLGRAVRPRPRRAVTHLGLLSTAPPSYFRKQTRPDHLTPLRLSTNRRSPCCCGPAPKHGRTRGRAPPSSITAQWKPLLLPGGGRDSRWSQSCVADGGHVYIGRKVLVTAVWQTGW